MSGDTYSVWKQQNARGIGYVTDTSSQTRSVHHPRHWQSTDIRLLKDLTYSSIVCEGTPPADHLCKSWNPCSVHLKSVFVLSSHMRSSTEEETPWKWLTIVRSSFLTSFLTLYRQQVRALQEQKMRLLQKKNRSFLSGVWVLCTSPELSLSTTILVLKLCWVTFSTGSKY